MVTFSQTQSESSRFSHIQSDSVTFSQTQSESSRFSHIQSDSVTFSQTQSHSARLSHIQPDSVTFSQTQSHLAIILQTQSDSVISSQIYSEKIKYITSTHRQTYTGRFSQNPPDSVRLSNIQSDLFRKNKIHHIYKQADIHRQIQTHHSVNV